MRDLLYLVAMWWFNFFRTVFLHVGLFVCGSGVCTAAPEDAVARVPSHGCSATAFYTQPGLTFYLTCAHAFEGKMRFAKIVLDVPVRIPGAPQNPGITLIGIDPRRDLAVIQLNAGPLPYVCPIGSGGKNLPAGSPVVSVGYDQMVLPQGGPRRFADAVVKSEGDRTYTRGNPIPGRSGGALIQDGYLVGVVTGYELDGPRRGIYVSPSAIQAFLTTLPGRRPTVSDDTTPLCPPGVCPQGT